MKVTWEGVVSHQTQEGESIQTEINLSASSSTSTGALRYSTAFHSSQLSGAMENTSCNGGQKRGNIGPG